MTTQNKKNLTLLIIAATLLAGFCLWVALKPPAFDADVLSVLASHQSAWADAVFRTTTWMGSLFVLLPLVLMGIYVLMQLGLRSDALFTAVSFTVVVALTQALKHLIARPRPGIQEHLAETTSVYAFPSSHVSQATAFALLAYLVIARLQPAWRLRAGVLLVVLVIVVTISRLYLQVHYPLDVLAGILTALVAIQACALVMEKKR